MEAEKGNAAKGDNVFEFQEQDLGESWQIY